jgi:hypothetical protein
VTREHILKMTKDRLPNILLNYKPRGHRNIGWPIARWEIILSHVGVCSARIRRGFELDDWIYCTLYIHNTGLQLKQRNLYSTRFQFTVSHALGFSVFTSRILAMDLSQSHCHFKPHVKSSSHSLVPFLPLFCSCKFRKLNSIQF